MRGVIQRQVFYPFLLYLLLFNLYAIYFVKQQQNIYLIGVTYLIEALIILLTFFSFKQKLQLSINNVWTYLDIVSKVLVLLSILMQHTVVIETVI